MKLQSTVIGFSASPAANALLLIKNKITTVIISNSTDRTRENLKNINCYSNEGGVWEKSKTKLSGSKLSIEFRESFIPRRGRINCSLNDNGKWRWFGTQFTIKLN